MTREEAEIYAKTMTYEDALYNLKQARAIPYRKATFIKVNELIKALSQEPTVTSTDEPMSIIYPTIVCDDAISREHLLSEIGKLKQSPWFNRGKDFDMDNPDFQHAMYLERKEAVEMIEDICIKKEPSVTQKLGHWIAHESNKDLCYCSECKTVRKWTDNRFCGFCGARMVEPQERSE